MVCVCDVSFKLLGLKFFFFLRELLTTLWRDDRSRGRSEKLVEKKGSVKRWVGDDNTSSLDPIKQVGTGI